MTYPGGVLLNKINKVGLLFGHLGPVPRDVAGARELGADLLPATTLGFLHAIATFT
jgi:hypothetical protein